MNNLLTQLPKLIDHTLLKPEANSEDLRRHCQEAKRFGFYSVCVNPAYVALAAELLKGSGVKVGSVIGFPFGATVPKVKTLETEAVIQNGADEIDMVINIGALRSGEFNSVLEEIASVRKSCEGKTLKVIIETAVLTNGEKVRACQLAQQAQADFVKTSTGYSSAGATVEDVHLLRETVGAKMGVKASGGIRNLELALKLLQAGATRLGTSASVSLVQEAAAAGNQKAVPD